MRRSLTSITLRSRTENGDLGRLPPIVPVQAERMADGAIRPVPTPENLPNDITAQKRIIAEMARDAATARAEIARLKFQ